MLRQRNVALIIASRRNIRGKMEMYLYGGCLFILRRVKNIRRFLISEYTLIEAIKTNGELVCLTQAAASVVDLVSESNFEILLMF